MALISSPRTIDLSPLHRGSSTDAQETTAIALRARLSTDDAGSADSCGDGNCAADGEIEDYLL